MSLEIITANRLRDGAVVWLGHHDDWVERIQDAATFDETKIDAALEAGNEGARHQLVVDVYRVPVELKDGYTVPKTYRERIRAQGPSVRLDLGKQALA
jgi:hypothetical protein